MWHSLRGYLSSRKYLGETAYEFIYREISKPAVQLRVFVISSASMVPNLLSVAFPNSKFQTSYLLLFNKTMSSAIKGEEQGVRSMNLITVVRFTGWQLRWETTGSLSELISNDNQ